jgi:cobalt-zinc-cadmium efflux system membrane fusion protein
MNTTAKTCLHVLLAGCWLALAACGNPSATAPAAGHEDEDHAAEEHGDHEGEDHDDHEGEDHEDHVRLTPAQRAAAGIAIATAGPATIREVLALYGVIVPNAERVRAITPRFPGVIRSVSRRAGDAVREGEVLATVESNESLQTYAVTAPLAGVVTARDANPGEQTGDRTLFTVADLRTVWVEVALFPRDRGRVQVGQRVRVRASDGGPPGEGEVVYVAPFGSTANQTLTARVLLDNAGGAWAPGLYVTAEVTLGEAPVPVAVRNEALQSFEGATVVFVEEADGFHPQPVRTSRADDALTEVTGGLAAGARYVGANSFLLKAELGKGEATHEH